MRVRKRQSEERKKKTEKKNTRRSECTERVRERGKTEKKRRKNTQTKPPRTVSRKREPMECGGRHLRN